MFAKLDDILMKNNIVKNILQYFPMVAGCFFASVCSQTCLFACCCSQCRFVRNSINIYTLQHTVNNYYVTFVLWEFWGFGEFEGFEGCEGFDSFEGCDGSEGLAGSEGSEG